jgi:hypothetical protein
MAGGMNPLGNTPGKVDSNNNLLVAIGAGSVLPNGTAIDAGTGTADAVLGGVLTVNTTQASTTAVVTEEDLWTYSLPANTLSANNKAVRITVFGRTAANANNKDIKLYFAGTVVAARSGAFNAQVWMLTATVIRTGASAQLAIGQGSTNTDDRNTRTTPAGDTTTALTIKMTGQNGTASANDIIFDGATVELLN